MTSEAMRAVREPQKSVEDLAREVALAVTELRIDEWFETSLNRLEEIIQEEIEKRFADRSFPGYRRAIDLIVAVRDSAVTDSGHCSICLADPHSSGCVIDLVEKFVRKLEEGK